MSNSSAPSSCGRDRARALGSARRPAASRSARSPSPTCATAVDRVAQDHRVDRDARLRAIGERPLDLRDRAPAAAARPRARRTPACSSWRSRLPRAVSSKLIPSSRASRSRSSTRSRAARRARPRPCAAACPRPARATRRTATRPAASAAPARACGAPACRADRSAARRVRMPQPRPAPRRACRPARPRARPRGDAAPR